MTRSPAERENARNLLNVLAEEHIERAVEAIWSGRQLFRAEIERSDDIAAEAVAKAAVARLLQWGDPIGEKRARIERRVSPAEQLTEWLEEVVGGRAAVKAWRADQAVARAAGARAVIRYAHELRGARG